MIVFLLFHIDHDVNKIVPFRFTSSSFNSIPTKIAKKTINFHVEKRQFQQGNHPRTQKVARGSESSNKIELEDHTSQFSKNSVFVHETVGFHAEHRRGQHVDGVFKAKFFRVVISFLLVQKIYHFRSFGVDRDAKIF